MFGNFTAGYIRMRVMFGPLVYFYCGAPHVEGHENLPATGPVIVASNHLAEVDSLCLGLMLRRQLAFLTKREYFEGRAIHLRMRARILLDAGMIPVDRSGGDAAERALAQAGEILDAGHVWAIYPEGTRSPDGRLHKGRTGTMRVALARGCPVVPVTIDGTNRIKGWKPAHVTVTIGKPIDLSAFGRDPNDRDAVRAATDALMQALSRQSGQEYVDEYARRRSDAPPA